MCGLCCVCKACGLRFVCLCFGLCVLWRVWCLWFVCVCLGCWLLAFGFWRMLFGFVRQAFVFRLAACVFCFGLCVSGFWVSGVGLLGFGFGVLGFVSCLVVVVRFCLLCLLALAGCHQPSALTCVQWAGSKSPKANEELPAEPRAPANSSKQEDKSITKCDGCRRLCVTKL